MRPHRGVGKRRMPCTLTQRSRSIRSAAGRAAGPARAEASAWTATVARAAPTRKSTIATPSMAGSWCGKRLACTVSATQRSAPARAGTAGGRWGRAGEDLVGPRPVARGGRPAVVRGGAGVCGRQSGHGEAKLRHRRHRVCAPELPARHAMGSPAPADGMAQLADPGGAGAAVGDAHAAPAVGLPLAAPGYRLGRLALPRRGVRTREGGGGGMLGRGRRWGCGHARRARRSLRWTTPAAPSPQGAPGQVQTPASRGYPACRRPRGGYPARGVHWAARHSCAGAHAARAAPAPRCV